MHFARNVHFTVKNGKADDFKRLMNTEILPLLKKEKGFHHELTVLGGNTGMSLSLWDDRGCAELYNTKTYPEVLKKLDPVLERTPRVETYETVVTTIPNPVHA
jgi:quinol monooxygenase YgiN